MVVVAAEPRAVAVSSRLNKGVLDPDFIPLGAGDRAAEIVGFRLGLFRFNSNPAACDIGIPGPSRLVRVFIYAVILTAADTVGVKAGSDVNRTAADIYVVAVSSVAAADARRTGASVYVYFTAGNIHGFFGGALTAAADAGAFFAACCGDGTAGYADFAVAAVLPAADACAVFSAGRVDCAAVDGHGNVRAFAVFSAADAGAPVSAIRSDVAAVDGNNGASALCVFRAVADPRAACAAGCADNTAVDGDRLKAAAFIIAAADARAVFAMGFNAAAVDDDMAAARAFLAADPGGVVVCRRIQNAGGVVVHSVWRVALAVDRQLAVFGDINAAFDRQVKVIPYDQADVASDGNAVVQGGVQALVRRHIGAGYVPPCAVFSADKLIGAVVHADRVVNPAL